MEKLVRKSLECARTHFGTFGFDESQMQPLLSAGERDLRKELVHLEGLLGTPRPDEEKVNQSLHALKGLLLNMGNTEAAQTFKSLEDGDKDGHALAAIQAILKND